MEKYIVTSEEIDAMEGLHKTHFLNSNAQRLNKSLGDITGLNNIGSVSYTHLTLPTKA